MKNYLFAITLIIFSLPIALFTEVPLQVPKGDFKENAKNNFDFRFL